MEFYDLKLKIVRKAVEFSQINPNIEVEECLRLAANEFSAENDAKNTFGVGTISVVFFTIWGN